MSTKLPSALTDKRASLARERAELLARLEEIEGELGALDYALRVLDAEWAPASKPSRKLRQPLLPRGAVARHCLELLRKNGPMSSPAIADTIAAIYGLVFETRKARQDFASSVTMALRRYERQGLLEVTDTDPRTQAAMWRLRLGEGGRIALVQSSS